MWDVLVFDDRVAAATYMFLQKKGIYALALGAQPYFKESVRGHETDANHGQVCVGCGSAR